ncbi:hypothetical protein EPUS_03099 [Endocarpon pusillum Z07020]|uniref:rRNA adenine N(6)-methyltransferase n=1 Tax=Endocarpon pusillum (strain Z07020 / HMAS-L-300199) TaxID=1263415 RepID=U1G785_ENDPU|nr:uncharacterized protein EPUS_03099 [Endocarpon pusillum Z07020]ERF73267.1 hypothetical protein EPUS_03099 [Endocarpon pusillum Z07020]
MPPSAGRVGKSASSVAKQLRKSLSSILDVRQEKTRINIISPSLCEDAIRRLRPSLPAARPLDIIDINPGVCLWSSRIHLALKPRCHILVEPDKDAYKDYVDPLLQQPGSRYRHVPVLSDLFGTNLLPDQTPVTSADHDKGKTNDSLLILANLTSGKAFKSRSDGPPSASMIPQYIGGILNQENSIHHYGLVRMLAWLPDDEKASYLPRTITERKKYSVRLDLVTRLSEIAGAAPDDVPSSQARRQHDLTLQGLQLVAQRAKASGVWHPDSRRPPAPTPTWYEIPLVSDALDQLRELPHKFPWQKELLTVHDTWRRPLPKVNKHASEASRPIGRPPSDEPESLRLLRTKFLTVRKTKAVAQQWADRQIELDRSRIDAHRARQSPAVLAATEKDIQQKEATLWAEMAKGRKDLALVAKRYVDDRRGFEQQPPLLQWDRRTAEPLLVKDEEFYPSQKLALLDFQPVPDVLERLNDFDKRTCFDYLCNILFRNLAQPVHAHLEAIAQGGLDEFVERVPDLTNPLKGGHPNLHDLRVRTLPTGLLVQLALALETWPFRLQTHEMIMHTSRRFAQRAA